MKGLRTTNPVAVGDLVEFEKEPDQPTAVISKVNERFNYILRKSINQSHEVQILASNMDQAILHSSPGACGRLARGIRRDRTHRIAGTGQTAHTTRCPGSATYAGSRCGTALAPAYQTVGDRWTRWHGRWV